MRYKRIGGSVTQSSAHTKTPEFAPVNPDGSDMVKENKNRKSVEDPQTYKRKFIVIEVGNTNSWKGRHLDMTRLPAVPVDGLRSCSRSEDQNF